MTQILLRTGAFGAEELQGLPGIPSKARLQHGAVAVIECAQEIPCNPCEFSCTQKAIVVGEPITNLPKLDADRCTGCGICIAACPGLAIFVVNLAFSENEAEVQIPYEFLPLPTKGSTVDCLDRTGMLIGKGVVRKLINPSKYYRTAVVSLAVPKAWAMEVRAIRP